MPPPDPPLPTKGLLIPMTQTLPPSSHPLTLPQVLHPPPPPPESPADPDLDNTEPCEAFTFDDSTLEHIMDTYSPSYFLLIKPTSIMSLNTLLLTMGPLLIGEPMVALLVLM